MEQCPQHERHLIAGAAYLIDATHRILILHGLRSHAYDSEVTIPTRSPCTGDADSPDFQWSGAPEGTESFALIVDDPDAADKAFVHWVIFNLGPDVDRLPANVDVASVRGAAGSTPVEGANDFGDIGYDAPCPPAGETHQYVARLYALDTALDLEEGAIKAQFTDAMNGHVLAEADHYGRFRRST